MKATRHQVLFVQGGGEDVHQRWDQALVESLGARLGPDYTIRYPRMPHEADPRYGDWKVALKDELAKLDRGAALVGHSIGGTVLINVLADAPPAWSPSGLFLISAPFVGKGGWPSEDIRPMATIGSRLPAGLPIYLYRGDQDEIVPPAHLELYEKAIPQAVVRRLAGRDHQLNNDLGEVGADIQRLNFAAPARSE